MGVGGPFLLSAAAWDDMRVVGAGSDHRPTSRCRVKKFQSVGPVHFQKTTRSGAAMASSTIDNRSVRSCTTFL